MKFLVDAQLPKSLSDFLCSVGYDSVHTLDLRNQNRTIDSMILEVAVREKRVVITKDGDFLDSFIIKSQPEKLILVKTGNIRNSELIKLFAKHIEKIVSLLKRNNLIEINKNEIVIHS